MAPPRILVSGAPGSGKTSLVRAVLRLLQGVRARVLHRGDRGPTGRTGFRVVALDGRTARLATVGGRGGPRVGRYAVHLAEFEAVALSQLEPRPDLDLLAVDEIGKMERLSPSFVAAARRALSAPVPLLATVALSGGGLIAEAKRAPGVQLVEVGRDNRDSLSGAIAERLYAATAG